MADVEQPPDPVLTAQGNEPSRNFAEPSEDDIEKLGRERPAVFKNAFMEIGFCLSVLASNLVSVSLRA